MCIYKYIKIIKLYSYITLTSYKCLNLHIKNNKIPSVIPQAITSGVWRGHIQANLTLIFGSRIYSL